MDASLNSRVGSGAVSGLSNIEARSIVYKRGPVVYQSRSRCLCGVLFVCAWWGGYRCKGVFLVVIYRVGSVNNRE